MASRRRPTEFTPEEAVAVMPAELIVDDRRCLCVHCEPNLDPLDRATLEADWTSTDEARLSWLTEHGVSVVEFLRASRPRIRIRPGVWPDLS